MRVFKVLPMSTLRGTLYIYFFYIGFIKDICVFQTVGSSGKRSLPKRNPPITYKGVGANRHQ